MKNLDPVRVRGMRVRLGLLVGAMGLAFGRLVTAAYDLQVARASELRRRAESQYHRPVGLDPRRGTIFDRNGNPLAVSVPAHALVVYPSRLRWLQEHRRPMPDLDLLARRLAEAAGLEHAAVSTALHSGRGFVRLKRYLTEPEAAAVRVALTELARGARVRAVEGVEVVEDSRRWYPQREASAQLVGVVGADGHGLEGLERSLEDELQGRRVDVPGVRDARGTLVFVDGVRPGDGQAGSDVQLTLDATIQNIAARQLALTCQLMQAQGGSVIVTNPHTGEVLAMASWPTYNPNDLRRVEADAMRLRPVTDRFEPGSTMKVFTVGAALESGAIRPGQLFNGYNGAWEMGDDVIHDAHPLAFVSTMQLLQYSSNIAAAQVGLTLGPDGLERALRRFGFGDATGLPLPGEARARFGGRRWYSVEVARVAYGQGIGVTGVQLAQALSPVANGGRLVPLLLVSRVTDATGALVHEYAPAAGRPVMSPGTARLLAEMLTSVTEDGTGTNAAIPGVRVAGKTGTAQKSCDPERDPRTCRGYSHTRTVSSFFGFAPAERPRVAVTVVIDEPQVPDHSGNAVAAPLFRAVTEQTLRYLGALPGTRSALALPSAPRAPHSPRPTPATTPATAAAGATGAGQGGGTGVAVPSLLGLTGRQALRQLQPLGITLELQGSGAIVRQEPEPGADLAPGATIRAWLEPAGGYRPVARAAEVVR